MNPRPVFYTSPQSYVLSYDANCLVFPIPALIELAYPNILVFKSQLLSLPVLKDYDLLN
jgi:hypothetical protein